LGALAFITMPRRTGRKTTLAVACTKAIPLIDILLPTNSLTKSGVATTAKSVEHAVSITESATSACAMRETKLLAVPPGEHPTKQIPRNNAGPTADDDADDDAATLLDKRSDRPTDHAASGMIPN
jgi:hypothetical protein